MFFDIFSDFFLWSQPHYYIFALTDYRVIFLQTAFKKKCKKKGIFIFETLF